MLVARVPWPERCAPPSSHHRPDDIYKFVLSHDTFTPHPIFILSVHSTHSLQFCELHILYTLLTNFCNPAGPFNLYFTTKNHISDLSQHQSSTCSLKLFSSLSSRHVLRLGRHLVTSNCSIVLTLTVSVKSKAMEQLLLSVLSLTLELLVKLQPLQEGPFNSFSRPPTPVAVSFLVPDIEISTLT